jgi:uncharacterized protein YjbJ (UPF0337 family)
MSCHQLIGNWKQVKGAVGEGGNKLTDDNVHANAGKRDILLGEIQERHDMAREEAKKELKDWEADLK